MPKKDSASTKLSPQVLHVLIALAGGDKHGWAILKDIESFTNGRVQLSAGTLYGLIKRLLDQELIAESDQRAPAQWDDQRRRYYRLTQLGREAAAEEIQRLEQVVEAARQRHLELGEALT